ncbi:hypothetical protein BMI_I623 [Brucella microti CCM 4915]|uniref:Uncharacterized protein n=2 Tax=Brucella TaxID=234 RepID=C7LAT7_BRUMC|nr:Hypothetical protein, conserved [Brucella suis ATCC 23445]ACU47622.1 hypothetical protein BMI_I623 [Brucella microti CCM 4915]
MQAYIKNQASPVHLCMVADLRIGESRGRACKNGGEEEYAQANGGNGRCSGSH